MKLLKSAGAIFAGLAATFILSIGTDVMLSGSGIMKEPFSDNSTLLVILILLYRCIYNIAGCYIAARLAPEKPMGHALILGTVGFILSIAGSILMRSEGVIWYGITLIVLAYPCAWLGGKLYRPVSKNVNA